jgi:hypothetical protein
MPPFWESHFKAKEFTMKKFFKLFGIIALVAVIGFSMVALSLTGCDIFDDEDEDGGGAGGTFTLTDIPAKYDGMYAGFKKMDYGVSNGWICGYQSWNEKTNTYTLCRVSNGRVSIPVWNGYEKQGYSGNKTSTNFRVDIYSSETAEMGTLSFDASRPGSVTFDSVTFSNGSVTKSWNDGN